LADQSFDDRLALHRYELQSGAPHVAPSQELSDQLLASHSMPDHDFALQASVLQDRPPR